MAQFTYEDKLGSVSKYTERLPGRCAHSGDLLMRSLNHIFVTSSSSSDSDDFEEDPIFTNPQNVPISFGIRHHPTFAEPTCRIKVGHFRRFITSISDLPGNDRVIHYAQQSTLQIFERRVIQEFTKFVRDNAVYFTGPFSCLQNVRSEVSEANCCCKIEADRPVPLYVLYMRSAWKAIEVVQIDPSRSEGRHLYHFQRGARHNMFNIRDHYIYGGGDFDVLTPERQPEIYDPKGHGDQGRRGLRNQCMARRLKAQNRGPNQRRNGRDRSGEEFRINMRLERSLPHALRTDYHCKITTCVTEQ